MTYGWFFEKMVIGVVNPLISAGSRECGGRCEVFFTLRMLRRPADCFWATGNLFVREGAHLGMGDI